MKSYTGIEYLCIDIANNFGLDKELFEDRIQWVKDNFNELEQLTDQVTEDRLMYIKSVKALRDVLDGKPTGHLISLDSTCSGMQILSALTGCKEGARITNLTGENKRYDAYTEVTATQNQALKEWGVQGHEVSRKDAKDAVMTSLYGSKATPKEIFGEDGPMIEAFYAAAHHCAPGAFSLLNTLLGSWNAWALSHNWKMPDGFDVHIKVMQSKETRIEVDELGHHKFKTSYKENLGSKTGISLPANVTHSVDAYVLRSLLRRCSYNATTLIRAKALLNKHLNSDVVQSDNEMLDLYFSTGIVDALWFDLIKQDDQLVKTLPYQLKVQLLELAEKMQQYKPFDVLTVHDAFRVHPNNGDAVRYHYKELLAELADSELLSHILSQLKGRKVKYRKLSKDLSKHIREANYPVC